jgi:nucleoid-associated protein YgaU
MRRNHWIILVGIVVVVAAALTLFGLRTGQRAAAPPAPTVAERPPAAVPAGPPKAEAPTAPSFDAVHIGPEGQAVLAGRAAPGADVTVLDHGQVIGHATADPNGEWVITPQQPLVPGPQELSLAARKPGEATPVPSTKSLAVLVPERQPGTAQAPLAVLLPQNNSDTPRAVEGQGARPAHHVALDIVEYDADGRTVLSGRADAGARIASFVNDQSTGTTTADAAGNWTARLAGVPVGRYRLRLEARARDGSDAGTLALELRRAAPGEFGTSYLAVMPGNTLWHLAQHSYGDGVRYLVLYRANRDKIANPDLIYPNELLALPAKR